MRISLYTLVLGLSLILLTPASLAEVVNINKADAATLQQHLKGIGPVKSKAIVDYRTKHGSYKSLDDLLEVPGVGPSLLEKNKKNLSLTRGVSKPSATQRSTSQKANSQSSTAHGDSKESTSKSKQTSTYSSKDTTKERRSTASSKSDTKDKKDSTTKKTKASKTTSNKPSTQRKSTSDSKEKK